MSKRTLLDVVQGIMSDADADNVNSIGDTEESNQCARIIRTTYDEIVDQMDLTHHEKAVELDETSAATPIQMTRPEGLYDIEFVKYNHGTVADPEWCYVHYLEPAEFLRRTQERKLTDSNVTSQDNAEGVAIHYKTDEEPTYFTFLDGYDNLYFDSLDTSKETFLAANKSVAYGKVKPVLALTDTAVLDLPKQMAIAVENIARAKFFDYYKDGVTSEVDRQRRRAEVRLQRQRRILRNQDSFTGPNFGRK